MDEIKAWLNGGQDYHTGCELIIRHHPNKALHQVFREAATPYKVQRLKNELLQLVQTAAATPKKSVKGLTKTVKDLAGRIKDTPINDCLFADLVEKYNAAKEELEQLRETLTESEGTIYELQDENEQLDDERRDLIKELTEAKKQPANRWGPPEKMPPVVHALWLEWKPLYSERNNIMARIYDVAHAGLTDEGQKQEAGRMAHRILDLDDQVEAIYKKRAHYIETGALPVVENAPDDLVVDPKKIPTALQNAKRYVREFTRKLKTDPQNAGFAQKLEHWQKRVDHYQTILNG